MDIDWLMRKGLKMNKKPYKVNVRNLKILFVIEVIFIIATIAVAIGLNVFCAFIVLVVVNYFFCKTRDIHLDMIKINQISADTCIFDATFGKGRLK